MKPNNDNLSSNKPVKKNKILVKKSKNISPLKKKRIYYKQKDTKPKKFNEKEFQKQLETFKAWEKKKKEKIEKLKNEELKKENDILLKNNIHHNKKMINFKKMFLKIIIKINYFFLGFY